MRPRGLTGAVLAGLAAGACATPSVPTPAAVAPAASAAPAAPAPPAANRAPEVIGDLVCRGPAGGAHVYPLRLVDPDGDRLSFRAVAVEPRGEVYPRASDLLASPADVEVTYQPPTGRRDENVIELTVTDARGATTVVRLVARSG